MDSDTETLANLRTKILNENIIMSSTSHDLQEADLDDIINTHGYDPDKDPEYVPPDSSVDSHGTDEFGHEHITSESPITSNIEKVPKKILTRKRKRNSDLWKCNVRKAAHASGEAYISVRKKVVPAKTIKTVKDCQSKCVYNCQKLITAEEREHLFARYYTLTQQEKKLYLVSTTRSFDVERHRKGKNQTNSRRKRTFNYFFNIGTRQIQVCKSFYLSTLAISQTPVHTVHANKDAITNIPSCSAQGKHTKHKISEEDLNGVKTHIDSFPRVESHYCRAETQRQFLDPFLNIKKMYELYRDVCTSSNKQPVKESFYRSVFCQHYNLSFHIPRKDRCDLCEEVKMKINEGTLTDQRKTDYEKHIEEKNAARAEKQKDRDNGNIFLVFDMQNVLSCPRAESHPHIELITMKFSTPGHSCNQEIDAVHSCIERVLKKSEYYSPVSLLRLLLKVNSKKPYKIMQLKENDFKDYKTCAALYNYKLVPFSQVTTLKFSRSLLEIEYKVSHAHQEWKKVCIREYRGTRSESTGGDNIMRSPTNISVSKTIPQNKTLAIRSMFKYMPAVDQAYYNSILPK